MHRNDFGNEDLQIDHQSLVRKANHDSALCIDADERQLSSDLESCLRLNNDHEVAQPFKKETRESCMFQGQNMGLPLSSGNVYQPYQHGLGAINSGCVRPESLEMWQEPGDIEMDNVPSMMSAPMPPPSYPYKPSCPVLGSPHQLNDYSASWMQSQNPDPQVVDHPEQYGNVGGVSIEAEMKQESMSYQLDEYGECALHTLSAVTDRNVMAKVLEAVQLSGSLPEYLNHQNKLKQTPLFLAVLAFNIPLIGWLLQEGADPSIQGIMRTGRHEYIWRAPLHLVAMMGDKALGILKMMLSKYPKLNMNILSIGDKLTPLLLALKNHSLDPDRSCRNLVLELIRSGADVRIREQASSKTALILAIETKDLDLVREYLEIFSADRRRALLQDKTRSGDTCLHIAAGLSRFPSNMKEILLRLLVMHGANGNTANNAKELPRDFARTEWDRIRS